MDEYRQYIISNLIVEYSNKNKLYHSNLSGEIYNRYLWTSEDINQAKYHIYDSLCSRFIDRLLNGKSWPYLFEIKLKRNIKLLSLELIDDSYRLLDEKDFLTIDPEIIDLVNSRSIINNVVCKDKYNADCNYKILNVITEINNKYGLDIDGYWCYNDQNEIALINPLNIIEDPKKVSLLLNVTKKIYNINFPLMTFDEYKRLAKIHFPYANILFGDINKDAKNNNMYKPEEDQKKEDDEEDEHYKNKRSKRSLSFTLDEFEKSYEPSPKELEDLKKIFKIKSFTINTSEINNFFDITTIYPEIDRYKDEFLSYLLFNFICGNYNEHIIVKYSNNMMEYIDTKSPLIYSDFN